MKMWLVGAGYWGSKVLETLRKFGVDATVIDTRHGQTIEDITDNSPVMLATPLWNHYEQCKYLLRHGHDVYVEKPMAETAQQVEELSRVCQPGQMFMVGHIFQHHPQRHELKTLIDTGFIGRLQHISSQRLNWGIYQTQTNPALSLAVHDISIILDFAQPRIDIFGEPKLVWPMAKSQWHYTQSRIPDRVYRFGHAGDVSFDVDVSWAWPERVRKTTFIGTQGQIVWNQDVNTYTIYRNKIVNNRAVIDTEPEVIQYCHDMTPLECEIKHWIDCVKNRTLPTTGVKQALEVAKLIDQFSI